MKPKTFHFFIVLIAYLLLLSIGCTTHEPSKGEGLITHPTGIFKTYKTTVRNYSLNIPSDWEAKEYPSTGMFKAVAAINNIAGKDIAYRQNITIEPVPVSTVFNLSVQDRDSLPVFDINTFTQWFFEDLQLKTTDYKLIEIGETLINGKHAAQYIYSFNNPQEFAGELKAISFLYMYNREVMVVTCVESIKKFQKAQKKFEYMAQSINHSN